MIEVFGIILLVLAVFYMLLYLWFFKGWNSLKTFEAPSSAKPSNIFFSILIPARNEGDNISECLHDFLKQDFPKEQFEIIVIDDNSTDITAARVTEIAANHLNIKLIKAQESDSAQFVAFKKKAIESGIAIAKGEWIVTSDADCRRGPHWLKTLTAFINENNPCFVSMPVMFQNEKNIFGKMQALEFSGLIGIGAASIANSNPNMCNGANLAYNKIVFHEVNGFRGIDSIASGDDELLMHKVWEKHPGKVMFLKSFDATAFTTPQPDLSSFLAQRKRWVSKSSKYKNKWLTVVMASVYTFNLLLLIMLVWAFINPTALWFALPALAVKAVVEFMFLKTMSTFFKRKELLKTFPLALFLYIVYTVFIGIYGNTGSYYWKERKVR